MDGVEDNLEEIGRTILRWWKPEDFTDFCEDSTGVHYLLDEVAVADLPSGILEQLPVLNDGGLIVTTDDDYNFISLEFFDSSEDLEDAWGNYFSCDVDEDDDDSDDWDDEDENEDNVVTK